MKFGNVCLSTCLCKNSYVTIMGMHVYILYACICMYVYTHTYIYIYMCKYLGAGTSCFRIDFDGYLQSRDAADQAHERQKLEAARPTAH